MARQKHLFTPITPNIGIEDDRLIMITQAIVGHLTAYRILLKEYQDMGRIADCPKMEIEAKIGSQNLKRKQLSDDALTAIKECLMLNPAWQLVLPPPPSYGEAEDAPDDPASEIPNRFAFKSSINGLIAGDFVDHTDD